MDQCGCQIESVSENSVSLAEFLADPNKHQPKPEFVNGSYLIDDKNTVLVHCMDLENVAAVKALLSAGADANLPNSAGIKPISVAAQIGNMEIMHLLIASGAVVNCVNLTSAGSTPMIQAAHFGQLEAVRLLLQHKAAADCVNKKGTTALMRAAQEGYTDIVTCLIEAGVDVNRKNHEGMTALLLASYRGHAEIASALVRAGANVNMRNGRGSTPLMLASKRGYEACAKVLISLGADTSVKDKCMRTALDLAVNCNRIGINRMHYPTEILPDFLYLGDSRHAANEEMMVELRVTHIVDATATNASRNNAQMLNIAYLPIQVWDFEGVDIRQHFQSVLDFVALAKSAENGRVLIHCYAGISRSSTFVLVYLMHSGVCSSLKSALQRVVLQRPCVMPNVSFRAQLMDYEESLFGTRSFVDDSAFLACMDAVDFQQCVGELNKSAQDTSSVTVATAVVAPLVPCVVATPMEEGSAATAVVMM